MFTVGPCVFEPFLSQRKNESQSERKREKEEEREKKRKRERWMDGEKQLKR